MPDRNENSRKITLKPNPFIQLRYDQCCYDPRLSQDLVNNMVVSAATTPSSNPILTWYQF